MTKRGEPPIIGADHGTITGEIVYRTRIHATKAARKLGGLVTQARRERDAVARTIDEFGIRLDPVRAQKVASFLGIALTLCGVYSEIEHDDRL